MTAQELHIDLDFQLQKINSNATRNIEPREKDWLLNQQVSIYLNKRLRDISNEKGKGFQEDTKRFKDVQNLVRTKKIEVEYLNEKEGRYILPSFDFKYVRADAIFFKKCEASKYAEKTKKERVFVINLNKDAFKSDFSISVNINGNNTEVFNTNTLPSNYTTTNFYLIKAIEIKLRKLFREDKFKDIELYFENYGSYYSENNFIIVGNSNLVEVVLSPLLIQGNNKSIGKVELKETSKRIYVSEKSIKRTFRLNSEETETIKATSSLSRSLQESPLTSIQQNEGLAYFPKNTIIKSIQYVYICNPDVIDIDLNQSVNLKRELCEEIVKQTALFIKGLFDSNNYEKYLKETTLIE